MKLKPKNIIALLLGVFATMQSYGQLAYPGAVGNNSGNAYLQFTANGLYDGTIRANGTGYTSFALYNNGNHRWGMYNHPSAHPNAPNTLLFTNAQKLDRIAFTQDGRVAIGYYYPEKTLHVRDTADTEELIESIGDGFASLSMRSNGKSWRWSKRAATDADALQLHFHNGSNWTTTPQLVVKTDGSVGIGTTDPKTYKLAVAGKMVAEEVVVKLQVNWPDYVFDVHYKLPTLSATEEYFRINKHLPEIPSAKEVSENGIGLGEMNALLLKKIEELTMHLIDQEKQIKTLAAQVGKLQDNK